MIEARPKPSVEMIIDGCGGFLFLDSYEKPKVAMHLENYMRQMQRKYRKLYGDTLPTVTPHVLRHTFCTNMQQAGLDPCRFIRTPITISSSTPSMKRLVCDGLILSVFYACFYAFCP